MFAIEDYVTGTDDNIPNMHTAASDYFKVFRTMNMKRGYAFVCMIDDKAKKQNNNKNNDNNNNNNSKTDTKSFEVSYNDKRIRDEKRCKKKWKLKISSDDIEEFHEYIKENILTDSNKFNHDGLIYFVSCFGDKDDVIYDSDGEEFSLSFIFNEFNNDNCKCLTNKPKIFIIDTSRGVIVSKMIDNPNSKLSIFKNMRHKAQAQENTSKNKNSHENDKEKNMENTENEEKMDVKSRKRTHASEYARNQSKYLSQSDIRVVYATPDGFTKIQDKYVKESILIKEFCKLCQTENNLSKLIYQTKKKVSRKVNEIAKANDQASHISQSNVVVDNNRFDYNVVLLSKPN